MLVSVKFPNFSRTCLTAEASDKMFLKRSLDIHNVQEQILQKEETYNNMIEEVFFLIFILRRNIP